MQEPHSRARQFNRKHRQGFTIVELLIVVVVIAILAAITIVSYIGISNSAKESALKSDLTGAAKQLQIAKVESGSFPGDTSRIKKSDSTTFQYDSTESTFCLTATSSQLPGRSFHITENKSVQNGACSGHTVGGGGGQSPGENGGVVTTLAGSEDYGFADGTGSAAQFNYLSGITVDSSGTVNVADTDNSRIRKITPAGVVTTLAGSGSWGFADGTGSTAQFDYPDGVAVDSAGTVYVADFYDHRIRKITPAGAVTTLAGSGEIGFADGTGSAAQFYNPAGVAVDDTGTVYVADSYSNRIRKITPAGVVTTLAGSGDFGFADGTGSAAQFGYPKGIAVDSAGTVYVADTDNNRIRILK